MGAMDEDEPQLRYRSVFISDVHLGTRGCQAELLLDFIRCFSCERLYLVGDILDGWKLKGGWWWPQAHNDVVQKILRLAEPTAFAPVDAAVRAWPRLPWGTATILARSLSRPPACLGSGPSLPNSELTATSAVRKVCQSAANWPPVTTVRHFV